MAWPGKFIIIVKIENGDIAQLVERLNGIQEVIGSIPTISTKPTIYSVVLRTLLYIVGIFFYFAVDFI